MRSSTPPVLGEPRVQVDPSSRRGIMRRTTPLHLEAHLCATDADASPYSTASRLYFTTTITRLKQEDDDSEDDPEFKQALADSLQTAELASWCTGKVSPQLLHDAVLEQQS